MALHISLENVGHSYHYQIEHILRIFYPQATISIFSAGEPTLADNAVTSLTKEDDTLLLKAQLSLGAFSADKSGTLPTNSTEAEQKRALSGLLFDLLSQQTGRTPPWGTLIGVRPVRLLRQTLERGASRQQAEQRFRKDYQVTEEKTKLAFQVLESQQKALDYNHPKAYSLYISIPFCPTRCLYCSFVSHAIERTASLVPQYVDALCEELRQTAIVAEQLGLQLTTVYVGGGTPTALSAKQLNQILETVRHSFDGSYLREFTVEAGRPDTVTREKLEALRANGVDRISINPQTMQDKVLEIIGRGHTVAETLAAYTLARESGFSAINMDLIAGLPGENAQQFLAGLDQVLTLAPDNVTIHTLTLKRSSRLWEEGEFDNVSLALPEQLAYAQQTIQARGYHPYYLYRQKGTVENLENVGYSLPEKQCYYNIYSMEENHTILATGAGGVSKLCAKPNRIERIYNYKYPYEYLDDFSEILCRKSAVRSFYERDK